MSVSPLATAVEMIAEQERSLALLGRKQVITSRKSLRLV